MLLIHLPSVIAFANFVMADPLSVAASIATLLAIAGKIIHKTYKYGADAKGAPQEISNFLKELTIMTSLLTALKSLVDAQPQSQSTISSATTSFCAARHLRSPPRIMEALRNLGSR